MIDLNFLHPILSERIVLAKNNKKIKIVGLNKNFMLDLDNKYNSATFYQEILNTSLSPPLFLSLSLSLKLSGKWEN